VSRAVSPVLYPVAMLVAVAIAIVRREPAFCAVAGGLGLGIEALRARALRTARGTLAAANVVTLLRLGIVCALQWLFGVVPRPAFVAIVLALLVLDAVDGHLARSRGEASVFGASLDMETDALTVMILTLLLHARVAMGPWVLAAGLWRYVLAVLVAIVPALGDTPPSRLYRTIFGLLMITLAGAFVPWPPFAVASAALGTALVSFSFLLSFARSRAFRRPLNDRVGP
jgi:phosphatidylglycerophosphate synthase